MLNPSYSMKISVISMSLIKCNIGTTFLICYMSPTYITKKLVGLPLIFLYIHMVHLYLIQSNILTISSKIEVPSPQYLSKFINVFILPLEITSLDKVWQQQESEQTFLIATCWVIPIGAITIVHTQLMFQIFISNIMVSSQLSESLLMTISKQAKEILFLMMYGVSSFSMINHI